MDESASCPVPMDEVLDYLRMEVPDGDALQAADLDFVRTVDVEGTRYWVWRFAEPDDGTPAYATVSRAPDGRVTVGYDAQDGRTPEQFVLGDYRGDF